MMNRAMMGMMVAMASETMVMPVMSDN